MKSTALREGLFWIGFSLALLFLLFPGLNSSSLPAFRDTFHFYYPLQVWLDVQREQGVFFPVWNSQDAFGTSVASEATSALFYPLRVVWFLPDTTVAQRLSVFIFVHLVIAALGVRYACRRLRLSNSAGCFAAVSYSLSCPVFFQHSNLVYLCSAAWIPWALAELGLLATSRKCVAASALDSENTAQSVEPLPSWCVFSIAATLMILSGDIQAAFHAVLLGIFAIVFRLFALRSVPQVVYGCSWLSAACVLIAGLAAVQWLPAMHAALASDRWANSSSSQETQAAVSEFPPEFHEEIRTAIANTKNVPSRYNFSVPPWHFASLVFPTVGGHFLPQHSRWIQALGAEGRMWIPSLYVGILPALLAVQLLVWPKSKYSRWLIWVTVLTALAAMGHYGPIWILRHLFGALGHSEWSARLPADEAWSVYWILSEFVPGYSAFRYPGKWTTWFACGLALMSATQFHQLQSVGFARLPRILMLLIAILSAALLAVSIAVMQGLPAVQEISRFWQQLIASAPQDSLLGLPHSEVALQMILLAAAVPLGVVLAVLLLGLFSRVRTQLGSVLVLLTMCEMVGCCYYWITFVSPRTSTSVSIAPTARNNPEEFPDLAWSNAARVNFLADCQRLGIEVALADRAKLLSDYQSRFLLGKLHLLSHHRSLSAQLSIEPRNLSIVRQALSARDQLSPADPQLDEFLAWLGVSQRLVRLPPSTSQSDATPRLSGDSVHSAFQKTLVWQPVPNPAPFVELQSLNESNIDATQSAVDYSVQLLVRKPTRLLIQVHCTTPMKLIIRQHQDDYWRATLQPTGADVWSVTDGASVLVDSYALVFQSIKLPAGDHLVTVDYSPWPRQVGAAISVLSLFLFLTLGIAITMPRPIDLLQL